MFGTRFFSQLPLWEISEYPPWSLFLSLICPLTYRAHSFHCYPHLDFIALTNLAPLPIKLQPTSTSSIYFSLCYPDDICLYPSTGLITPPSIPPSLYLLHFCFFYILLHHFSRNKHTFLLPAH
ncbi:hypothetical protein KMAR_10804 [Kluyveromyces marxianus]|uniref:Uncharacterized protein n=1 Tax=Kluyveromyces marxianus (strain DMKU3-1042 / BCC 29191 / NBRC 104275) TaxID=1003335 RepID=A0A1L7LMB6_KLUMD|nr:hypothetical protein KLMA_80429 [Kluyveromyces marxianus DMKU3-1042]BAP70012.1 hypothetical protein KMAR_10804 [Kluyveromyces marxianus]BAQ55770.1 hypothetical protein KLMA_80429 [Kluyveromyces marxianus DMKU3-1042]